MSATTFNEALEGLFRAMRDARVRPTALPGVISLPQMVLLLPLLDGDGTRSVRELADAAGIASPTATRMLDGLEREGVINRRPSETDRRSVLVELTAVGRVQTEEAREAARAARLELYRRLEPHEREEAERIVRRLTEIIRSG